MNQLKLINDLIQAEPLFGERIFTKIAGTNNSYSLTFHSRMPPPECQTSLQTHSDLGVTLVSQGSETTLQIIGSHPEKLASNCIFTWLNTIRREEAEGLKLVAHNLGRMEKGERLYLEFRIERPELRAHVENIINSSDGQSQMNYFGSIIIMIFCVIILVWNFRFLLREKRV